MTLSLVTTLLHAWHTQCFTDWRGRFWKTPDKYSQQSNAIKFIPHLINSLVDLIKACSVNAQAPQLPSEDIWCGKHKIWWETHTTMQETGSHACPSAIPSQVHYRAGIVFLSLFIFRVSEVSLALNSDLFKRWNMPTFQLLWSPVLQNATQFTLNQSLTVLWWLTLTILWAGKLDFLHCKPRYSLRWQVWQVWIYQFLWT